MKKTFKCYPDDVLDAVVDAVAPLTRPDYMKARGLDERKDRGGDRSQRYPYSSPASNLPAHNGGTAPPPVYVAPPAYTAPPGFQLVQVAHTAAVPPPQAAGGGGARKPSVGKSQQDPTKTFAPAHYAKPCMYCSYPSHNGDNCWKTFPELRVLNQ